MRPTVRQLLDWRPHRVAAVADGLALARRRLLGLDDELTAGRVPTGWHGASADAARADHRLLAAELNDLLAGVAAVLRSVDIAAEATLAAQRVLQHALSDADREDFAVDRDLVQLTDRRPVGPSGHALADRERRRDELTAHLHRALDAAAHADEELADVLARVARGLVDGGHGSLSGARAAGRRAGNRSILPPPADDGPGSANAWWRGLTGAEQRTVIADDPAWIGNLPGIPAWARHLANLQRLQRLLGRLRRLPFPGPAGTTAGLEAIDDLLRRQPEERQLLLLEPAGSHGPRAVIGLGDVDRARHVTVFVPGFGADAQDGLLARDRELDDLRRAADRMSTEEANAVVLYLGAETPQPDAVLDLGHGSVLNDDLARAGGAGLADFLNGIDAARSDDPHLTTAGHSYGSVTAGFALRLSTGVDDAVHLGSPGLGVDDLTILDVPAGHHHQLEAPWDGVADSGWFGADPSGLEGIRHLSTEEHHHPDLTGTRGHTSYLADGSTSQHNLAAVGAGRPDLLIDATGEPGEIDQLREEWRRVKELLGIAG